MTKLKTPATLASLATCACFTVVAVAFAAQQLTVHASFHPDKLGAATNATVTAKFQAPAGEVPTPISSITAYLPAGLRFDLRGSGTCTAERLEGKGPGACPADSRIGFGGGRGVLKIGDSFVRERFTIDLFLASREEGHLVVLGFVEAKSPAFLELVIVAHEVHAPRPYGLGFTFTIPQITTLPEAPAASVETAFITVGDAHAAFYQKVNGREKLVRVRGFVLPSTCPRGGFPSKVTIDFADGSTMTSRPTFPCPQSRS
jgi:hypothetical protein